MAQLKLTKNELRAQQLKLGQLEKYLPTLKLKKAMLQIEVADAKSQVQRIEQEMKLVAPQTEQVNALFSLYPGLNMKAWTHIERLEMASENIAGVEVPLLQALEFAPATYLLSQTPVWLERGIEVIRAYKTLSIEKAIADQRLMALEKELREVSIRVNLFEKVLIPRCIEQIKKIKVFLQDQDLAAVGRSKVAKSKHRPQNTLSYMEGA